MAKRKWSELSTQAKVGVVTLAAVEAVITTIAAKMRCAPLPQIAHHKVERPVRVSGKIVHVPAKPVGDKRETLADRRSP